MGHGNDQNLRDGVRQDNDSKAGEDADRVFGESGLDLCLSFQAREK